MTAKPDLSYEELARRSADTLDEVERLEMLSNPTKGQLDRLARAKQTLAEYQLEATRHRDAAVAQLRELHADPANVVPGDGALRADDLNVQVSIPRSPFGGKAFSHTSDREMRSRAIAAVEQSNVGGDAARNAAVKIIEADHDPASGVTKADRRKLNEWVVVSSDPDYVRAFSEVITNPHPLLSGPEVEALRAARAMSLTDGEGGYGVPATLDPSIVWSADGALNEIRQAATVRRITSDVWHGVTSDGISASWDGEATEVSDDAPTIVGPSITPHKAQAFVPYSIEVGQDYGPPALVEELARLFRLEFADLEGQAFATGTGSDQPFGIVTALVASSPSVIVSATTDGSLGLEDVYLLNESLPARHRAGASWLGHQAIYNLVRQFDTTGGAALWTDLGAARPGLLLGKAALESETMDSTLSVSTTNYVLVFGDFSNYVVVDRMPSLVLEPIAHLFGASQRPTGQRGLYGWQRTGGDSIVDGAFRLLDV